MAERPKGGYTWYDFEDMSHGDHKPRLFHTQQAAKAALTMWLKGQISKQGFDATTDGWTGSNPTVVTPPSTPRDPSEYEVCMVRLTVNGVANGGV